MSDKITSTNAREQVGDGSKPSENTRRDVGREVTPAIDKLSSPKSPTKRSGGVGDGAAHSARPRPYDRPDAVPSARAQAASASSSSIRTDELQMTAHPRRNVQATPPSTSSHTDHIAHAASESWNCPHCPFVQKSPRRVDLRRHIQTHLTPDEFWACCGVPVARAKERGLDMRHMQVYIVDGTSMVGGCGHVFSRRDALLRHLRNGGGRCVWDEGANVSYQKVKAEALGEGLQVLKPLRQEVQESLKAQAAAQVEAK